jgi:hypothetical protein
MRGLIPLTADFLVIAGGGGGGGGGNGGENGTGTPGTANTGGGGGGNGGSGNGSNGGSGVVIIKIPDTHSAIFSSGVDFGTNAPDYDNGLPITSVSGFNIYFVSGTDTDSETVAFYENFSADFLGVAGGGGGGGKF